MAQHALDLLYAARKAPPDCPVERLWALVNLTSLIAGHFDDRNTSGSSRIKFLRPSPYLRERRPAERYAQAVADILESVTEERVKMGIRKGEWTRAVQGLTVFSERTHLQQLLESLEQHETGLHLLLRIYSLLLHR